MKKIILSPNATRDDGYKATLRAAELLKKHGRRVVICPIFDDGELAVLPSAITSGTLESELTDAELAITFGGDGTILRVAREASGKNVPVLGVNMGGKGFMAELELEDLEMLSHVAAGEYAVGKRMMLDVEIIRGSERIFENFALNDVVIGGINKVIDLEIFGDGHRIQKFSGDGAIIATPTGSTAYSMSAGGPIVEPAAHNIIVTPICAHVLEARPYVLVSSRRVTIELGSVKQNPAYLSVDGCDSVQVFDGDIISVRKSERITRFVRLSDKSFYRRVSEKLGERL